MAGFGRAFATGFLNQISSGIENKNKYEMEMQRDLDKIAMNNIFETARDFQKTYPKSVGEIRKKHERFLTAMQLTNNNQAAAETIAADTDIKLHDFDKISEIARAHKDRTDYVSGIPKDTQAQLDALNASMNSTFDQVQKYMDRSKAFKRSGMESPFQRPSLDAAPLEAAGTRPAITLQPKSKDDDYKKFVMSHADRFATPEAALGFFNSLREKDGVPPIPIDQASRVFAGVTFGAASKDYNSDPKFKAAVDQARAANPNLSPEDAHKVALAQYTRADRQGMKVEDSSYMKLLSNITAHVLTLGKVDFVQDPITGAVKFSFSEKMGGLESRVAQALEDAQDALRYDILMGKDPQTPAYYANGAARKNKFLPGQAPEEQPKSPDTTQQQSRAQRAGVGTQSAPQSTPPAAAEAPKRYRQNPDGSITEVK